ncbi:MAG: hypothetical protein OK449_07105 [Thaumarchaeota archaeon]|nr:hypothetical protein [Nitrososphaerota archaeon]
MSDPDEIDEVFRDLRRFAERRSEYIAVDNSAFVGLPQIDTDDGFALEDELILGDDYVTYLIFADERKITDFSISMEEDWIEVKTVDFTVKKTLGMRVDPEDPSTSYANGVLSVKVKRLADRDAVG